MIMICWACAGIGRIMDKSNGRFDGHYERCWQCGGSGSTNEPFIEEIHEKIQRNLEAARKTPEYREEQRSESGYTQWLNKVRAFWLAWLGGKR